MLSVLESRLSTRACLSTLSSVASCPSPCVCLSPCFGSANPRLNAPSPYSLIRPSSRIHFSLHPSQTDVCPLTPHPSCPYIDPTSSAHVRRSRTHQPRDRPPPQSSSATTRAPSNITSPPWHSHRHPGTHIATLIRTPRASQPPFCPPTPHSQLPLAFRPQPSSTLRPPCASVCPPILQPCAHSPNLPHPPILAPAH